MTDEEKPDVGAPGAAIAARLSRLAEAGLLDHYVSARDRKTIVAPDSIMPSPPPLLAAVGLNDSFVAKHDRIGGPVPSLGFFTFEDHYAGRSGTIFDPSRRICYDDGLISSYWMWYNSKVLDKHIYGREPQDGDAQASWRLRGFLRGELGCNREIDEGCPVVNLVKPGQQVYGHWLLDVLPSVWLLMRARDQGLITGELRYLVAAGTPRWGLEFLKTLFGIGAENLLFMDDFNEIVRVRTMIVPSTLRSSPLIAPLMNEFVDFLKARVLPLAKRLDHPKKIFISRNNYSTEHNKALINAGDIADFFHREGFAVVQPELMPWPEQIAMFAHAQIIAGEFGSGPHNALLSGAQTVPLIMLHLKHNWNQSAIAALRGQRIAYVAPEQQERTGLGAGVRFTFDIAMLAEAVAAARSAVGDDGGGPGVAQSDADAEPQADLDDPSRRSVVLSAVALEDDAHADPVASQRAYADHHGLEFQHKTERKGDHDAVMSRLAYAVYALGAGADILMVDPLRPLSPETPDFRRLLDEHPDKDIFHIVGPGGDVDVDLMILRGGHGGTAYRFTRAVIAAASKTAGEASLGERLTALVAASEFSDRCLALDPGWGLPVALQDPETLVRRAEMLCAEVVADETSSARERGLAAGFEVLLRRLRDD